MVNTGQSTLSGTLAISTTNFGAGCHNNGVAANDSTNSTYFANGNLPGTITYTLDTAANPLGYDISTIRSFTGWSSNSTAHANQSFDVEVSLVGVAAFALLQSVNFTPFFTSSDGNDRAN